MGIVGSQMRCVEMRTRGFSLNHKTIQRLMKEIGLVAVFV